VGKQRAAVTALAVEGYYDLAASSRPQGVSGRGNEVVDVVVGREDGWLVVCSTASSLECA
jgi:hypothetical protein